MMEQMTFTGDPFVDLGALVVETLPEKTIEDKIHELNLIKDRLLRMSIDIQD